MRFIYCESNERDYDEQDECKKCKYEWSEAVDEAFEQLTAADRNLVHWLFVEGLSLSECTKRAAISLPGIKKHRQKMIAKLREVMVK